MSTSFYLRGHRYDDYQESCIGTRTAAGLYCYDCKHHIGCGSKTQVCQKCGKIHVKTTKLDGPVAVELGFQSKFELPKKGVHGCSKFFWLIGPSQLQDMVSDKCPACNHKYEDDKVIEDEYGRHFTLKEFFEITDACIVQDRERR